MARRRDNGTEATRRALVEMITGRLVNVVAGAADEGLGIIRSRKGKGWWGDTLERLREERWRRWRKYNLNPDDPAARADYKATCKAYNQEIRRQKRKYWSEK